MRVTATAWERRKEGGKMQGARQRCRRSRRRLQPEERTSVSSLRVTQWGYQARGVCILDLSAGSFSIDCYITAAAVRVSAVSPTASVCHVVVVAYFLNNILSKPHVMNRLTRVGGCHLATRAYVSWHACRVHVLDGASWSADRTLKEMGADPSAECPATRGSASGPY